MVKSRFNTPIINEWKKLFKKYSDQGLSKTTAFEKIATEYGTTRWGVEYHLIPGRKEYHTKKARENYKKNMEKRKTYFQKYSADKKRYSDSYKSLINNLNFLFQNIFSDTNELTQKEIYNRTKEYQKSSEYSESIDGILSVLPIEKVRPGIYRFKKIKL